MQTNNTSASRVILLQDAGLAIFMAAMIGGALVTALAGRALLYQNLVMLAALCAVALLAALRARTGAVVAAAETIIAFTAYKLYNRIAYSAEIEWMACLWPPLVLLALGGMTMFISLFSTVEGINGLLNRRIDELTVVDPLTGLENLRSMTSSLARYMALCERNGTEMGLMLVRLRYGNEIRKVLTTRQFNDLRAIMADVVLRALRLEDRVFTIDDRGSLGIIYFSKAEGASIVRRRILDAVKDTDLLPQLEGRTLDVELSVVYRNYDKGLGKDALRYISEVEKEFAYED